MSDSATPWTVAHQAPLSKGFSRPEYWSGLPFPSPGDLPNPRIKAVFFMSPALAGGFFTTSTTWEAPFICTCVCKCVCMHVYMHVSLASTYLTHYLYQPISYPHHINDRTMSCCSLLGLCLNYVHTHISSYIFIYIHIVHLLELPWWLRC